MAGWRGYRRNVHGYGARGQGASRLGALLLSACLQIAVIVGVIAAFTPDVGREVLRVGLTAIELTPEPRPTPTTIPPPVASASKPAGAAGEAGRKAVAASLPKIVMAPVFAPIVASTGAAMVTGARDTGGGSGAGAAGAGTGAGGSGNGEGGGGAKAVKIAGEINSAKDYPIASRDLRIGDYVIVAVTVGTDGRPTACRVHRASCDAAADAVTCRLAMQRFRFRPATDAAGNPVEAVYGWKQGWHY